MISSTRNLYLYGGLVLLAGLFFYINFRPQHLIFELIPSLNALQSTWLQAFLSQVLIDSLPSFLHILFMCLFTAAVMGIDKKSAKLIPTVWLVIGLALEVTQIGSEFIIQKGTFDTYDLLALLFGSSIILFLFHIAIQKENTTNKTWLLPLLGLGLLTSIGSELYEDCHEDFDKDKCVVPVTLTWEELRSDIQPDYGDSASLSRPGKIYAKDHLYIVDQYRGIHIFDQADPQNPTRLVFIPIIGALEVSIVDNTLYTNSFTDLIAINLDHIFNSTFNSGSYTRKIDVFAIPTRFDFLPDDKSIDGIKYDEYLSSFNSYYYSNNQQPKYVKREGQLGFIIGYIDSAGNEILFGEFE